jgi:glutamine synthetase
MLANKFAARALARRALFSNGSRGMASTAAYDDYGKSAFTGSVADAYLQKHGSSGAILKDPSWTKNHSDVVAAAVLDW